MTSTLKTIWNNGRRAYDAGHLAEAEKLFLQVLAEDAGFSGAFHFLGVIAFQNRRYELAIERLRRAAALRPDAGDIHDNLGMALAAAGHLEEAIACFLTALSLMPDRVQTHASLAAAYNDLGAKWQGLERHDEAIVQYRNAINLQPKFAQAHHNLGSALHRLNHLDEAIDCYDNALALRPDSAETYNNLAATRQAQGHLEEAITFYRKSLDLKPDFADGHYNLSLALMTRGEFAEGWREYEFRWLTSGFKDAERQFPWPKWDGRYLGGQRILLHGEQGAGDTLQFMRYVPLVIQRGGKVTVVVQRSLTSLLQGRNSLGAHVVSEIDLKTERFAAHLPLMSLPWITGVHLPDQRVAPIPYISAESEWKQKWSPLVSAIQGLKVGLVWAGNPTHKNDHNRSMKLSDLTPLARAGVRFVSLQVGPATAQINDLKTLLPMIEPPTPLDSFAETAGLIDHLDLIIAVDTAVAHLAGAMGKPVWMLVPFAADWRWMQRDDSPWYPTMRIFRQKAAGDWSEPVARVQHALRKLKNEPKH